MRNILLFSIVVTIIFCAPVLGYDWSTNPGNGSPENPYQIGTAEQLDSLHVRSDLWNSCFQLTADIDMSGYAYSTALIAWHTSTKQGFEGTAFTGIFDGNGYTITGLTINGGSYNGMFGYLDRGLVTNVRLNGAFVKGSNLYTGGIAGYSNESIVSHCGVSGRIIGSSVMGGVVGENYISAVVNSYSSGVFSCNSYGGGVVGVNWSVGLVLNCYCRGTIEAGAVGGIVGRNAGNVSTSYAACDINASGFAGGVVGLNHEGATVTDCLWDTEIQTHGLTDSFGYSKPEDIKNVFGLSTHQMQSDISFLGVGWDFLGETENGLSETWMLPGVDEYPVLSFFHTTVPWVLTGDGTVNVPYKIKTAAELGMVSWYRPYAAFEILEDIDLSGIQYSTAPIPAFCGTFDGCQRTISNFNITGGGSLGFFARIKRNAMVKNLSIENSSAKGFGEYNGILSGFITDSEISKCRTQGSVTGSRYIGGCFGDVWECTLSETMAFCEVEGDSFVGCMAGTISDSEAEYCLAVGTVSGGESVVGGFAGRNWNGEITACGASCDVTAGTHVGGLVGEGYGSSWGCFSKGTVQGNFGIGGLIGYQGRSLNVSNCYSLSTVTADKYAGGLIGINTSVVKNCYSAGDVQGSEYPGGFIGSYSWHNDILNCFWDMEVQTFGVKDSFGLLSFSPWDPEPTILVTGLSTEPMQSKSTFINAGWDFMEETANGTQDIWWIDEGNDYPRLWWELNMQPVADSGEDITAYAWVDGLAQIKLDGTGSYDPDGDTLEYFWYNDANELIATGAEPNVLFGVGQYGVTLIVNDGIEDSEPNSCTVTVLPAIEMRGKLIPKTLNRKSKKPHVIGRLKLAGVNVDDLDPDAAMILMPGNIEAGRVDISGPKKKGGTLSLTGFFDHGALMDAIPEDGDVEISLAAKLITGQWVYGMDVVRVK